MKIAIVHDWLTVYAGAERCLEQMLECFPHADLFALIDFVPAQDRDLISRRCMPEPGGFIRGRRHHTRAVRRELR